MRLLLASASPRRAELLKAAGYEFDVRPVNIDESLRPGETPQAYVARLADEKSARGAELAGTNDVAIIGADTIVVVDSEILGKPADARDAERMLRRLSGRTHQVLTGVSLRVNETVAATVDVSEVVFSALSEDQVRWYVDSGEGLDKAGAYAIQGLASRFIPAVHGSYSNVVGLPVAAVERLISQLIPRSRVLASHG
jgi:septum formation protein